MKKAIELLVEVGSKMLGTKQRKVGIVLLLVGGFGLAADGCKSGGIDKGYAWCVASHTAKALVTCPRTPIQATPKGQISDGGHPDKPATRPGQ